MLFLIAVWRRLRQRVVKVIEGGQDALSNNTREYTFIVVLLRSDDAATGYDSLEGKRKEEKVPEDPHGERIEVSSAYGRSEKYSE